MCTNRSVYTSEVYIVNWDTKRFVNAFPETPSTARSLLSGVRKHIQNNTPSMPGHIDLLFSTICQNPPLRPREHFAAPSKPPRPVRQLAQP